MRIELTLEAKAEIQTQFALLELQRPALYMFRAPASADVTRTPDGEVSWSVERPQTFSLRFGEMPDDPFQDGERARTVDGVCIVFVYSPPTDDLKLSVRDRELFVDVSATQGVLERHDVEEHARRGIPMGLLSRKEVLSSAALDRLRSFDIALGEFGFDFHSLQWERYDAGSWKQVLTLTRREFQGSSPFRRWVSDIHSIEPSTGIALLQVAEGDRPYAEMQSTTFHYSWRAWNLRSNVEVRRLKDCDRPGDPLE